MESLSLLKGELHRVLIHSLPPIFWTIPLLLLYPLLIPTQSSSSSSSTATHSSYRRFCLLIMFPLLPLIVVCVVDNLYCRYKHDDLRIDASFFVGMSNQLPPTLPPTEDPRYDGIRSLLTSDIKEKEGDINNARYQEVDRDGGDLGYALVTGSSSGIGKSIAVQLARRGIPLILVSRGSNYGRQDDEEMFPDNLALFARDLKDCYGVKISIIRADLSKSSESRRVHVTVRKSGLNVKYLILAAGICQTTQHIDLSNESNAIERAIRINVESTALLASLFGSDMAKAVAVTRQQNESTNNVSDKHESISVYRPHILIVSSVMGIGQGLPGAALYGATKAFGVSLARGLAIELEPAGVGVTVLCPGATQTNFAKDGGLDDAAVWNFPFSVMNSDNVAEEAVYSMLHSIPEYVPGFLNRILFRNLLPMMPTRAALRFFQISWSPWPFDFPPGWKKGKASLLSSTGKNRLDGHQNEAIKMGCAKKDDEDGDMTCQTLDSSDWNADWTGSALSIEHV